MQVNKDLAVISQTRQASCRRLSFAVRFNERIDKPPALSDSSVGFNPFQMSIDSSLLKGLKPTEEEALPPNPY